MKHGDIETGGIYAMRTGYGRPEAGDSTNVPVKVLDREKVWTVQYEDTGEVNEYGRKVRVKHLMRYDNPRATHKGAERFMLVQRLDPETMEPAADAKPQLTLPRDLAATWERHLAYAALREANAQALREQRAAEQRQREHVSALLAGVGVEFTMETYPRTEWAMDEGQALALVKMVAELQQDRQALIGLREDEGQA